VRYPDVKWVILVVRYCPTTCVPGVRSGGSSTSRRATALTIRGPSSERMSATVARRTWSGCFRTLYELKVEQLVELDRFREESGGTARRGITASRRNLSPCCWFRIPSAMWERVWRGRLSTALSGRARHSGLPMRRPSPTSRVGPHCRTAVRRVVRRTAYRSCSPPRDAGNSSTTERHRRAAMDRWTRKDLLLYRDPQPLSLRARFDWSTLRHLPAEYAGAEPWNSSRYARTGHTGYRPLNTIAGE